MAAHKSSTRASYTRDVVRVLVVDDHPVFRRGLVHTLHDEAGIRVCGEAATIADAVAAVRTQQPDVAIIDLSLGGESGLDLVKSLRQTHPAIRMLMLSGHDEQVHADRALKAGALGFIMKDKAAPELCAAIRRVAAGRPYVSPETADRILAALGADHGPASRSPVDRLSDRERSVLVLLGRAIAPREIATRLGVSVRTVESHCAHIKAKLGVRTGRELMRVAVTWTEADRM